LRAEAQKAKEEADKTKMELEKTTTELTSTKGQLDEANKNLDAATKKADKAVSDLAKAQKDNASMLDEVKGWRGLNKTLAAVKKTLADYPKVVEERDVYASEKKILEAKVRKQDYELAELRGEFIPPPPLPAGLKGKIVQVDPKFDFVVLNIGGNVGVIERGEMLINRNGRLIGKVRITSVMPDKCIANVLKAWKQDEPFEGDEVLY